MKAVLWIFVLIIAPFVIAKVDQWRKRGIGDTWAWWKSENMPYELRSATLFLSEQDISTTQPVPMHGRVDQVYKAKNGVLIPLDTKLRQVNHIYESDIISSRLPGNSVTQVQGTRCQVRLCPNRC